MCIKEIFRDKTNDSIAKVTEQKASFFFKNNFLKNGQLYNGWALSIPVVVVVHVRQEKEAWAKIGTFIIKSNNLDLIL
jgi:hypothetical protein